MISDLLFMTILPWVLVIVWIWLLPWGAWRMIHASWWVYSIAGAVLGIVWIGTWIVAIWAVLAAEVWWKRTH